MSKIIEEKIKKGKIVNDRKEVGMITFKYIKDSECPECGAEIQDYSKSSYNKWEESVRFKCGCKLKSKTPFIIEQVLICKESKPYKKLKKLRLKQLEKVNKFVLENVSEERLFKEITRKLESIKYDVEDWWNYI